MLDLSVDFSVLNTFKTMITDEDALAEEDLFILDKMKEMVSGPEVIHFGAAKQLLSFIERAVSPVCFLRLQCRSLGICVAKGREPHQDRDVPRSAADSSYPKDIKEVKIIRLRSP
jgi:hypothetical protein